VLRAKLAGTTTGEMRSRRPVSRRDDSQPDLGATLDTHVHTEFMSCYTETPLRFPATPSPSFPLVPGGNSLGLCRASQPVPPVVEPEGHRHLHGWNGGLSALMGLYGHSRFCARLPSHALLSYHPQPSTLFRQLSLRPSLWSCIVGLGVPTRSVVTPD
jgi:hypothetical protein